MKNLIKSKTMKIALNITNKIFCVRRLENIYLFKKFARKNSRVYEKLSFNGGFFRSIIKSRNKVNAKLVMVWG